MKYCRHCGNEVADEAIICLKCGCKTEYRSVTYSSATPYATVQSPAEVTTDETTLGTASMWCGIGSFFIGWFALGITAMVLAQMSKEDNGNALSSHAKVGFTCGLISTILSVVLIIPLIIVLTSL